MESDSKANRALKMCWLCGHKIRRDNLAFWAPHEPEHSFPVHRETCWLTLRKKHLGLS